MAREIKFRVWDEYNKRMNYNCKIEHSHDDENGYWLAIGLFEDFTGIPNGIKIMQYTGLKDKNKVNICQKDIAKLDCVYLLPPRNYDSDHENLTYYGVIHADLKYEIKLKCFACYDNNAEEWLETFTKIKRIAGYRTEIIGNIYEHPNLKNTIIESQTKI